MSFFFEAVLLLLFLVFEIGAVARIIATLERKGAGHSLEWDRLLFFFLFCLMLACLAVLEAFGRLGLLVGACIGGVALTSAAGFALTFRHQQRERAAPEERRSGVRAYQLYYQGEIMGLITKEGVDRLLESQLLKRQRTIELVEDYRARAQEKGVAITLLRNPETGQVLVKVERREQQERLRDP